MTKMYHVYGMTCPIEHKVFYIGMTTTPARRLGQHQRDPSCAPYHYCQHLKELGLKPYMVFFGAFENKQEGKYLEARLTVSIPGLHNRVTNTLPPDRRFWMNLETACYNM